MKLYRFETFNFRVATVICSEYEVIKETPAGYWIEDWSAKKGKRWVSKTGFKRFAYVDKVDAAASYLARSRKYIEILLARQRMTAEAVAWFEENKEELIKEKPVKLLEHRCIDDDDFEPGCGATKVVCAKCNWVGSSKSLIHFPPIRNDDGWFECPACNCFIKLA